MQQANIRNVDLNLLVVFDALLDELSVTRASARLSASQPAVSHALRRLRQLFDDPLFVRNQRGLTPTPRATELREPIKRLLAEAEGIIRPVAFDPANARATVTISTTDYMQFALLLPLISLLRDKAPGISLILRSLEISDLRNRMAAGDIDIAITTPEFAEADFRSRFLYRERYVCAVRADHPLARTPGDLDAFCAYEHILVSPAGGSASGPTDEALARLGRSRHIAISAPNFLILPHLLIGTDLVAVVPERLVKGMENRLAIFDPLVAIPDFDVIAIWHPRMQNDPLHRWLRGQLHDVAQSV